MWRVGSEETGENENAHNPTSLIGRRLVALPFLRRLSSCFDQCDGHSGSLRFFYVSAADAADSSRTLPLGDLANSGTIKVFTDC